MRTLHDMDGWVYKKKNITAVMEIIKERFVPCCVMSCRVVLCRVISWVCCKGLMQRPGITELLCHETSWPEDCQAGGPTDRH